jgi:hypothetical protein
MQSSRRVMGVILHTEGLPRPREPAFEDQGDLWPQLQLPCSCMSIFARSQKKPENCERCHSPFLGFPMPQWGHYLGTLILRTRVISGIGHQRPSKAAGE